MKKLKDCDFMGDWINTESAKLAIIVDLVTFSKQFYNFNTARWQLEENFRFPVYDKISSYSKTLYNDGVLIVFDTLILFETDELRSQ